MPPRHPKCRAQIRRKVGLGQIGSEGGLPLPSAHTTVRTGSVHGGSSAPLQIPELSQKVQESPHRKQAIVHGRMYVRGPRVPPGASPGGGGLARTRSLNGQRQYLWRAVDQDGDLIDILRPRSAFLSCPRSRAESVSLRATPVEGGSSSTASSPISHCVERGDRSVNRDSTLPHHRLHSLG